MERERHYVSPDLDQANYAKTHRKVNENKDLSSSSFHLTANLGQKGRSKKANMGAKRQAGFAAVQVKRAGASGVSRYLKPSRRKGKNNSGKVTFNLHLHVVPTLSPELNISYSECSQFKVVKYHNLSSWIKSLTHHKRLCSLTDFEIEKLASVYRKRKLASLEKEILNSTGEKKINVKDQHNLLGNKSEDALHTSVLTGHLGLLVNVRHDHSLDPNVTKQFSAFVSALAHLPADSFSDEGKHWSSQYNTNCYLIVDKVHEISAKPKICSPSNDGDPLVLFRPVTVNDLDEICNSKEELICFQENLYSLLRFHTNFESQFILDAKLWWKDIGLVHVYNIALTGIFLYLALT